MSTLLHCLLVLSTMGFIVAFPLVQPMQQHTVTPIHGGAMIKDSCTILNSKLFGPEEVFDDGIGSGNSDNNSDNTSSNEGQQLAKEFFDQVRKMEQEDSRTDSDSREEGLQRENPQESFDRNNNDADTLSSKKVDPKSNIPNTKSYYKNSLDDMDPTKRTTGRKFTGRPPPIPNSGIGSSYRGSLFGNSSSGRGGGAKTPREQMMEREYQLVGQAEKGIAVQALFAVVALCFYIYVGLTGGIVSGEESTANDFGGEDMMPLEELMPVQKDTEVSVWL